MKEENKDIIPSRTPAERALDVTSFITSAVPWIGGPVSNVLGGISFGRKLNRVREVLTGFAEDLKGFRSELSEEYVKTEEFEELLERTLRLSAEERHEEKRRIYRLFLTETVKNPGKSYDEQIRFLCTLEDLQADDLLILRAISQPPSQDPEMLGSPMQTLRRRLPQMNEQHIRELVNHLNDNRITTLTNLGTIMTGRGAEDLVHLITPYGHRFVQFIKEA